MSRWFWKQFVELSFLINCLIKTGIKARSACKGIQVYYADLADYDKHRISAEFATVNSRVRIVLATDAQKIWSPYTSELVELLAQEVLLASFCGLSSLGFLVLCLKNSNVPALTRGWAHKGDVEASEYEKVFTKNHPWILRRGSW